MRRLLAAVLLAIPGVAGADFLLSGFEAADIGNWQWRNPSPNCDYAALPCASHPCVTVLADATEKIQGSTSAKVYLLGTGGDTDCTVKACAPFRVLTLSNLGATDWTGAYTRLTMDIMHAPGGSNVTVTMTVKDDGGKEVSTNLSLSPTGYGQWNRLTLKIQDMLDVGFNVSSVMSVRVGFSKPTVCTTLYLDNLNLVTGTPPAAPTGVSAVPTGTSGQVRVSWNPVGGAVSYCVYWADQAFDYPNQADAFDCTPVSSPFIVTGLPDNIPYWFKVVAIDGNGDRSPAGNVGQNDSTSALCMLSGGIAAFSFSGGIRVMWPPIAGATYYRLFRAENSITCPADKGTYYVRLSATDFYDDKNVTPGKTYCYIVSGDDGGSCVGPCSSSTCLTFNASGCAPPWPIAGLVVTATSTGMMVKWDRPVPGTEPITRYEVIRNSSSVKTVYDTNQPYYSVVDDGVTANTLPCYQVVAYAAGTACTSTSVVDCSNCALGPPTNLVASACAGKINISFDAPGLKGPRYKVYRMDVPGTCAQFKASATVWMFEPSSSIYFDDITPPNGIHYYRMTSTGNCESDCSAEVSANYTGAGTCPCIPAGKPGFFTVTPGSDRASVFWERPAPGGDSISRYVVMRGVNPGGNKQGVATVYDDPAASDFTTTVTGLSVNTQYCWQVVAISDVTGCTRYSDEVCSNTLCKPPAGNGPLALSPASGGAGTELVVTWSKPGVDPLGAPLSGYRVLHSQSVGGPWTELSPFVFDGPSTEFSFTHTGIVLAEEHCYQVAILDQAAPGSCSAYTAAKCAQCNPPSSFSILSLTAAPPNMIAVSWSKPASSDTPLSRYIIYRATGDYSMGWPWAFAATVFEPTDAFFLDTLPAQTNLTKTVYYMMVAIDSGSCSIYCGPTSHSCNPPGAFGVTTLQPSPDGTRVDLQWSAAAIGELPITRYSIKRGIGGAVPTQYRNVVVPASLSLWDTPAASLNVEYCYEITAYDTATCYTTAATACYNCTPPDWGGGPSNISATAMSDTVALVSWDRACDGDTPVSRYVVYRSADSSCDPSAQAGVVYSDGCSFAACSGACPVRFSFTDTGRSPATTYYYHVLAVSMTGCTVMSTDCSGTETLGGCRFTTTPAATPLPSSVVLKWDVSYTGTLTGFEVWRGETPTGGTTSGKTRVATLDERSRSYADAGLGAGKTYCYVLVMNVIPSCSAFSEEVCVSTLKMKAYPNPAKLSEGPVRFDGLPVGATVEIYTINGEKVMSYTSASGGLWAWDGKNENATTVASGIYLYLIRDGGTVTKGKLVINR